MRKGALVSLGLIVTALVFSSVSDAKPEDFRPEPQPNEKLASPIQLGCAGIEIIEWKSSPHFTDVSSISDEAKKIINQLCAKAISKYPEFLASRGFAFTKQPLSVKLSLLPANTLLDGKNFRNLNDYDFRFKHAFNGCCVWGLYYDPTNSLFVRNDPLKNDKATNKLVPNKYFARTFLHEMAHVFNHQWEVRDKNFKNNNQRDEEVAEEWIAWLGISFPTETADEDLRQKGIKQP